MAKKKKADVEMYCHGVFERWDPQSKELPKLKKFTTDIPAEVGIEFGYLLIIRGARGKTLSFKIDHPPFRNESGEVAPPFTGEEFIRDNEFRFFVGDCVWAPAHDKQGDWQVACWLDGELVADKTFVVGNG